MDPQQRPRTVPNQLTSEHEEDASDSSSSAPEHAPERMPMSSHHISHGAVASHFQAYGGETWMDFLRDFGTDAPPVNHPQPSGPAASSSHNRQPSFTLPNRPLPRTDSSSSRSSERKRRLTSAEAQPLRRPSGIRVPSHGTGSSSTDPIMISASPPTTRRPSSPRTSMAPARRQSDIVIPAWQPDAEVSECPVCGRPFTFLYRKHHCRKCGRVVCAACSPHRITIPRQFIVHPPTDNSQNIIDLTGEDGDNTMSSFGPFRNPALGGGEEVRVCNPCVPDPNFSPPPQYNPSAGSRYPPRTSSSRPTYPPAQMPPHRQHRVSSSVHNVGQTVGHQTMHRTRDMSNTANDNRRVSYHGSTSSRERWLPPVPGQTGTGRHTQFGYVGTPVPSNDNPPYIPHPNHYGSTTPSGGNMFPRIFAPVPQVPAHFPPGEHSQRPRRQIAEEDECPICGHELPPRDPEDDDAARTQHITECITLHSASPPPNPLTQQTSASLPNQRTRGMSNAGGRGNNEAGSSNPNRLSHATRGMFPYVATEKDCVDEDGETAECIICLEDLEAGVKMARLVCWCKFHEDCIKEWWEKKGRGACPTHQLQE